MLREKMEIFRDKMLCLYMAGVILPPMLSDDNRGDSDDDHSDSDDTQHDSDDNSRYHHDHDNTINVKNQFSKGHDDKVSNHATTTRDFDDDDDDDDVYKNIYVAVNIKKKKKIRRRDKPFQLLLSQFKINSELVYELYNTTIHDVDDGDDDKNDDDNYIDISSDDIDSNDDSSYNNSNERDDSSRINDVIVDVTGEEKEMIILTKIDKVDNTVNRNSDKKRINVDENRRSRIKRSNISDDHHDIDDDSIDNNYLSVKSCFIISPAARIDNWLFTLSSIRDDMILNFVMRCNIKYNINNNIYSNSNRRDRDSSSSGGSHDSVKDRSRRNDRSNSDIGLHHYHNHGYEVISLDAKLLIYNSIIISNTSKDLYNIYNVTANIISSSYTMININNFNSIMRKKKIKMRKINNYNDLNNNNSITLDDDIDNNYYDIEVSYSTSFNIYNHLHHNDLLHHHLLKDIDIEFHSIIITSYSQLSSLLSPANNNHHHPSTKLSSSPSSSSSSLPSSSIASKYLLYFHSKAKIIMEDQLSSGR
jgi:hypothetical protein